MNGTSMWVLAMAVCICDSGHAHSLQEAAREANTRLWSLDEAERRLGVEAIVAGRRVTVDQCCKMVLFFSHARDPEKQETVRTAVNVLGELRLKEAAPLLAMKMTFHIPRKELVVGHPVIGDVFPCVGALIDIGLPSVDPVMKKVEESDGEGILKLSWCVLYRVLGPKLSVAYLEDRITQHSGEKQRARLTRLRDWLQQGRVPSLSPSEMDEMAESVQQ